MYGESKVYLEVAGRPLVAHVVEQLVEAPVRVALVHHEIGLVVVVAEVVERIEVGLGEGDRRQIAFANSVAEVAH